MVAPRPAGAYAGPRISKHSRKVHRPCGRFVSPAYDDELVVPTPIDEQEHAVLRLRIKLVEALDGVDRDSVHFQDHVARTQTGARRPTLAVDLRDDHAALQLVG